jgi:hypothetical protein
MVLVTVGEAVREPRLPQERGDEGKMYVMQISAHTPESCPVFNEHTKEVAVVGLQKMEALLAKHGVKLTGMWNDHGAHVVYNIYETPSMDAFMEASMEPEMMDWLSFNTVETKVVFGMQEIKAMMNLA